MKTIAKYTEKLNLTSLKNPENIPNTRPGIADVNSENVWQSIYSTI
jgi:hypothetical protein